jgi:hypothetical protein
MRLVLLVLLAVLLQGTLSAPVGSLREALIQEGIGPRLEPSGALIRSIEMTASAPQRSLRWELGIVEREGSGYVAGVVTERGDEVRQSVFCGHWDHWTAAQYVPLLALVSTDAPWQPTATFWPGEVPGNLLDLLYWTMYWDALDDVSAKHLGFTWHADLLRVRALRPGLDAYVEMDVHGRVMAAHYDAWFAPSFHLKVTHGEDYPQLQVHHDAVWYCSN